MSDKVLIIGIDSMDPYVLLKYRSELPTLSSLMERSPTFISRSIFPPDSVPAWASIYTGLNPAKHGVFYVFDVFDPNLGDLSKVQTRGIIGKTFWDYATKAGLRSVVLFPLMGYPPWEINGIMISKNPMERRVGWIKTETNLLSSPSNVLEQYSIPETVMGLWGGFPGEKNLKEWAELGKDIILNEKNIGLKLCKREKWDLFFIYFSLLDIIQHRLWRFFDTSDPLYPGDNPFGKYVLEYYKIFDTLIRDFMDTCPDSSVIVMSDHGHRSRPFKTVNINEYLRQKKLLKAIRKKLILSKLKKIVLTVSNKLGLEPWLIKIVSRHEQLAKASKSLYSSSGMINREKSIAYLSTFAGIKSYPHGGIVINKDVISMREYARIRQEIITILGDLKDETGRPIFQWIKPREEVYQGEFLEDIYPDILFELRDEYGVGWDLFSGLFGIAHDHSVASGGHRKEGVFLLVNIPPHASVTRRNVSILDTAPTVLSLLEIDWRNYRFDGVSVIEKP